MSCHYTCASCSEPAYFDTCQSCPNTRQLVTGMCQCIGGYLEVQTSQCVSAYIDNYQMATNILYVFGIIFHIVCIIGFLCRYRMVMVKKLIDISQMLGLVIYLRFNFSYLQSSALSAFNTYNFAYLNLNVYCTANPPPLGCYYYQNLIAPGIVIAMFGVMYLIAYGILYYRNSSNLPFAVYHQTNWDNCVFQYINSSVIINTVSLLRVTLISTWALLLLVPFVILLIYLIRKFYLIINHADQTKVVYRTRYSHLFLYDEYYHVNYIDDLYNNATFIPKSNYLLIEILAKMCWSTAVIICYAFKPALSAYIVTLISVLLLLRLKLFMKSQNMKFIVFTALDLCIVMVCSTFWLSMFNQEIFILVCAIQISLLVCFVCEVTNYELEKKLEAKIFASDPKQEESKSDKKMDETNVLLI